MTKKINRGLFAIIAVAIFGVISALAQSTVTGGISGKVTDPAGAIVTGATVTVTNIGTNVANTAVTAADGAFRMTNLQPGNYRVETTATGFGKATAEVVVEVGAITSVDVPLTVGAATGEVTVTAEAPALNTNDATNATGINQTSINELPINGRRASNFVLLTPGVTPDGNFGLLSFRGVSGLLNNSTIDGGDNNQAFFSEERGRTRISYSISQDAVREFQVNTSNYSAEFGRSAGGVVNTVTKSGTNEFHGSAFWYYRPDEWAARNPFSFQSILTSSGTQLVPLKPEDKRHQFGGSVGGPIVKDKFFFFFSYDQQRRNFPGVAAPASPTFLNAITVVAPPTGPGGRVCPGVTPPVTTPPTTVTTVPGEILQCRGVTQTQTNAGLAYLTALTGETPRRGDQIILLPKIDWIINEKHTLTAVYNRMRWDAPAGVQSAGVVNNSRTSFGNDFVDIDTVNVRLNSSFSPTFLNEARGQWSKDFEYQTSQTPDSIEPTTGPGGFPPGAAIATNSGGITIGKLNFLDRTAYPDEKRWQFADAVTLIRGKHTIKFGGDFSTVSETVDNLFQNGGIYTYGNLYDWITDFNIPSQKRYTNYAQGFGPSRYEFSTQDYAFFYQQDVRLDANVTLNFGMRWEYQAKPDPQVPNALEPRTSVFPSDKNNFGPRIGFAYSFGDQNENVVRAGYGIFYGRVTNSAISNAITNTGGAGAQRSFSSGPSASTPTYPNVLTTANLPPSDIVVFASDNQNPMIHQLDAIYERQLGRNTVVSVTGMMSYGRYLPTFIDTNLNPSTTTSTLTFSGGPFAGQTLIVPKYTGTRPNTNFGRITTISSTVSSEYYGLVLQANRRLTNGIQFQTSYTWSSAKDYGQNSTTFTSTSALLDPKDPLGEYGTSRFDVPHRFVASMVYAPATLFGLGGDSSVGRAILGGWTIAPIFTAQSGFAYTATTSGNIATATSTGVLGAGSGSRLYNTRNNEFRAPYIWYADLRVSRRIRFTESMNLEFLVEGFNIFNRANFSAVNTRMYSLSGTTLTFDPLFGTPSQSGNSISRERQIQFAARFQF